jgi:hypothetical protein
VSLFVFSSGWPSSRSTTTPSRAANTGTPMACSRKLRMYGSCPLCVSNVRRVQLKSRMLGLGSTSTK